MDLLAVRNELLDPRIARATESFERRLSELEARLRLDMAALKFDLLKWTFLFWVGQIAVVVSVLSWMLRGIAQ